MKTRVRAVIIEKNSLLLIHRLKNNQEYWVFPGGGVEQGEDFKTALLREVLEELGVEVIVIKQFANSSLNIEGQEEQQEIFYLCSIVGGNLGTGTGPEYQQGTSYKGTYELQWIPLDEVSNYKIVPESIKTKLIEDGFEYVNTISLNGRDGSGKSQQLRLLNWGNKEKLYITKPLINYSDRWPKLKGSEMSQWWFQDVPMEELTDIIIESLNSRYRDYDGNKITVHDRGWRMFKAVCVATKVTREKVSLEEAIKVVDEQFEKGLDHTPDEAEILLEVDSSYFSKVKNLIKIIRPDESIGFTEDSQIRYVLYQKNLTEAMNVYFSSSNAHLINVCEPIIDIQNKIRSLFNHLTNLKISNLGQGISLAVGFGGLSECGKSSFAENLRSQYNFLRLKLRYFIEIIEQRGDTWTPESVFFELLHFLEDHPYVPLISFESLHGPDIPAMIKLMLGNRCKIVFIDTEKNVRVDRCAKELDISIEEAARIVVEKDKIKQGRGADAVKDISDIVFNNSSQDHELNIEKFVSLLKLPT